MNATSSEAQIAANNNDSSSNEQYDIVLYGATSFVGQLTAEYLNKILKEDYLADNTATNQAKKAYETKNGNATGNENADADKNTNKKLTWAIAGRNEDKLNQVKQQLGNADLPIIIANSNEQDSVDNMAARAKVIISTVGPYLVHGEPLIKACVTHGTDYVDLTGEAVFIKRMMDKYLPEAQKSGARIVNSCGFDSIPSDLGVYFTQESSYAEYGQPCDTIHMRVKAAKGGLSGGTVASMATIFTEVGKDKSVRKQLANPYLLNNDEHPPSVRQISHKTPKTESRDGEEKWIAPFIMDTINSRIVHRSNQCLDYSYGRNFKYDEALLMPSGLKGQIMSYGMTAGIGGFAAAMIFEPSRKLLNEYILPKSGDGPSKEQQQKGYFDVRFEGLIDGTTQIKTKVTSDKDPGYGSTCRMLAQAALCLRQDVSDTQVTGGFWTPASAMGNKLISRLEKYAGINFEVLYLNSKESIS